MAYNQGLAVGLAIGIPCFLILIGSIFLYRRHKRIQRKEDKEDELDVELRENGSFKEFGEALHRPFQPEATPPKAKQTTVETDNTVDKSSCSADTGSVSNSRETFSSQTQSSEKKKSVLVPVPPDSPLANRNHTKSNSAYEFYNTFIPIMPADASDHRFSQPPNITGSERHSVHSNSNGSLTQGDNSNRSLDNLAKQLQNPQFFEKLPSRASTTYTRPPPGRMSHASSFNNSTSDIPNSNPYEHGGINDNFVVERSSPQKHPYRAKVTGNGIAGVKGLGLENNFDNNINPDANFGPEQDVVFK